MNVLIQKITQEQLKPNRDVFKIGDGVRVHVKIREGEKERIQIFAGIVIARRGSGIHASFTVRRVSFGEGVERVFALHSPRIEKIEVERESVPMRRAKLYYLRQRIGKEAVKVKEKSSWENKARGVPSGPKVRPKARPESKAKELEEQVS
jgi:large subunit ribosomal protein L19